MDRVKNKVALVTGAGLGLGRAAALLLAREGARVVVTDVKEAEGAAVAEEINAAGGQAIFRRHDVASPDDWRDAVAAALNRFGRLDILVNNAGVALAESVEAATLERWRWLMSINLDGVFLGTQAAIAAMKESGGSIINLSSIEGLIGDPNLAAYNASKGRRTHLHQVGGAPLRQGRLQDPRQLYPPRLHLDADGGRLHRRPGRSQGGAGRDRGFASGGSSRRARRHRLWRPLSRIGRKQVRHRRRIGDRRRLHGAMSSRSCLRRWTCPAQSTGKPPYFSPARRRAGLAPNQGGLRPLDALYKKECWHGV
jgi:short-subunit dehydrogenase involved in D-alanine esterification of teichoic acids